MRLSKDELAFLLEKEIANLVRSAETALLSSLGEHSKKTSSNRVAKPPKVKQRKELERRILIPSSGEKREKKLQSISDTASEKMPGRYKGHQMLLLEMLEDALSGALSAYRSPGRRKQDLYQDTGGVKYHELVSVLRSSVSKKYRTKLLTIAENFVKDLGSIEISSKEELEDLLTKVGKLLSLHSSPYQSIKLLTNSILEEEFGHLRASDDVEAQQLGPVEVLASRLLGKEVKTVSKKSPVERLASKILGSSCEASALEAGAEEAIEKEAAHEMSLHDALSDIADQLKHIADQVKSHHDDPLMQDLGPGH